MSHDLTAEYYSIGQISKMSDVGIETIRFYERKGLIENPSRKPSGYRQYPKGTVDRLLFIKNAKGLGFSLAEISELLSLRVNPKSKCLDVKKKAEAKIDDINSRIRSLQRMKTALTKLSKACGGKGSVKECPILEALEESKSGTVRK